MFRVTKKDNKAKNKKIRELKKRCEGLEYENDVLRRKLFKFNLKYGEETPQPRRRIMKVMGKTGNTGPR